MDHALENLSPETFQQLCQTLLAKGFPDTICLPVGQPDGGRDAILPIFDEDDEKRSFRVFQIKFSRNPKEGESARKWVLDTAENEIEKAKKLRERGATHYYLITNVPGTSHLDAGSIDTLQRELQQLIGMPVTCWWRDDINRRLDGDWDTKLRYPQVLTGQDFLRLLLEQHFEHDYTRHLIAIRAFLVDQYEDDVEVKFKQVELQNKLLDLFVDLPFRVRLRQSQEVGLDFSEYHSLPLQVFQAQTGKAPELHPDEGAKFGTASLLLSTAHATSLSQLVIEGAPGQGKSTLAQYLCQVHRIRWLNKSLDLNVLPVEHRESPLGLPFKVDLRDLATWLGGTDPFAPAQPQQISPAQRSLETFLAHMVKTGSGGHSFSVSDLLEVAKQVPLFIVLDGLDEVADIKRRAEIVSAVTKSSARLKETCAGCRLIVTSRPSAFANSPGFDAVKFPVLQLGSVQKFQIDAYATRWMSARNLNKREQQEFKGILNEKLDEPHLRDLARNPMQLTILLSLIHTRGSALPDRRTSLYHNYVDLFFSREAAKSSAVRKHIELLKDIHGYLAWSLHSDAERTGKESAGRISTDALHKRVRDFLEIEQHSTDVLEEVFKATVERVFMIVSRIEGTYEFEVQPLREYFAARFLYDTAPYSPTGTERQGTKPDRFDAIARNSYWLNVVRFFCGCFSKGELLDLADRVKELVLSAHLKNTRYPVTLAAMLLSDWVFSQAPRAVEDLAKFISQPEHLIKILPDPFHMSTGGPIRIPDTCGGDWVTKGALFILAEQGIQSDVAEHLISYIKNQCEKKKLKSLWMASRDAFGNKARQWFSLGMRLDVLFDMSKSEIELLADFDGAPENYVATTTYRLRLLENNSERIDSCFKILMQEGSLGYSQPTSPFYLVPHFLGTARYWQITAGHYGHDVLAHVIKDYRDKISKDKPTLDAMSPIARQMFEVSEMIIDSFLPGQTSTISAGPLENIVEKMRSFWGGQPALVTLAAALSRIPKAGRPKECGLFDESTSLSHRIRFAKSQAKKREYWQKNIAEVRTFDDQVIFEIAYRTWAPPSIISDLHAEVGKKLDGLSTEQWHTLIRIVCSSVGPFFAEGTDEQQVYPQIISSEREAFLAAHAASQIFARDLFVRAFAVSENTTRQYGVFRQKWAFEAALKGLVDWPTALSVVRQTYAEFTISSLGYFQPEKKRIFPDEAAAIVLADPLAYPYSLWSVAERGANRKVRISVQAVGKVAADQGWFLTAPD